VTRWGFLAQHRAYVLRLGLGMFALAMLVALSALWGKQPTVPASTLLLLFGMWCLSAYGMLGQMMDAQARVDMIRAGRGEKPE
jgi:hypothetical protein